MEIIYTKKYLGANVYAYSPVIEVIIDLGNLDRIESREIPEFNQKLVTLFPGLKDHYCSTGKKGGFIKRLEEGTYLGHVIEHLILELQVELGYDVYYGKTVWIGETNYRLVFEYMVPEVGFLALEHAIKIVEDLAEGIELNIEEVKDKLANTNREYGIGPSTLVLIKAAKKMNIPVLPISRYHSLYQLGYGKKQQLIEATIASSTSCIGVDIVCDKVLTNSILSEAGIPVPRRVVVDTPAGLQKAVERLNMPLVVKPSNGNHGKAVNLEIYNWHELKKAFFQARQYSNQVIVEEFITGKDYRFLVIGNKLVAASERRPPAVIGDGKNTISRLIDIINKHPDRGEGHERPLTKIKKDQMLREYLYKQGYKLETIPAKGQKIKLRANANLSTGGTARDVTDYVHPENSLLAVRTAQQLNLDIAGIDIIAPDIRVPLRDKGAIIEVNAAPGIRMHHFPFEGKKRNVAGKIINYLFPNGDSRIPLVAITGTNGKTTTARLLAKIVAASYENVGLTITEGTFINDTCIMEGDNTGPISARILLRQPSIDIAILETARGGIIREGLGYDQSDIGIITNISEDHLGVDGIESINELTELKSLVIETVKKEGYSILNADDSRVVELAARSQAEVIFFSLRNNNVVVEKHCSNGGKALVIKEESIIFREGKESQLITENIRDLPITFNGLARHNVANILAVVTASLVLGLKIEQIKKELMEFGRSIYDNIGRLNIFNYEGITIILDYGHNPAGFEEVFKFMYRLDGKRLVGVIGVPGDRKDSLIRKAGYIASNYLDKIYIKEDYDLRGREPGEVSSLILQGLIESNFLGEYQCISSERDALRTAIKNADRGDVIVCFYEKGPEDLIQIIRSEMVDFEKSLMDNIEEKVLS